MTDSFQSGLLDHPHYTRPAEYRGMKVPEVLLSGNHEAIRKWRYEKALERTLKRRKDLLNKIKGDDKNG
jgi:tRNA (guanine37-N1)-methyltransferase